MSRNRRPTLDHASGIRLEQASLKAWPAIEQTALDGWLLRYSEGVTKRANSVQALGGSNMPFAEKIERCERWYAVRERPCIFRLTPFSEAGLDARLAERGYANIDATAVLERPLDGASAITATDSGLRPLTLDAWVDTYARLHGLADGTPAPLRSILDSIAAERLLASLPSPDGATFACGLGVLEDDLFGLFNLVTEPGRRRQGHGTRLVEAMIRWARERGATRAYLQVVRTNEPALRLYGKLGFALAYGYWYRIQPDG